ncbi:MAG: ribonuclease H-like domain-containing protein [Acidobacteriota bacterium]
MHFRATSPYDLHRPSKCEKRVALRHRGVPEADPSEFVELLRRLGERHERAHCNTLADVRDLSPFKGDAEAHERETLAAIRAGAPAVYQARFSAEVILDGETHDLVGEPDFLILAPGGGYFVRDSKLARHVGGGRHPEIVLQLQLYGWLYERAVGAPPAGLEVHCGTGAVIVVPYDGKAALDHLRELRRMRLAPEDAYEPVGWSKCAACGYRELCWKRAEAARDVALLPGVSQDWARRLHEQSVADIPALRAAFDRPDLRPLFCEPATRKSPERMKPAAVTIRRSLKAHESNAPVPITPLELPGPSDCVILDLEGLPPQLDELEKVYLWGIKDFRCDPPRYLHADAGIGEEGDRRGWEDFLRIASGLLEASPDLRFVHYGNYEQTKINLYLERFPPLPPGEGQGEGPLSPLPPGEGRGEGVPPADQIQSPPPTAGGVATGLLSRLFDLHRAVKRSFALPVPSNSLKQIEKLAGFSRELPDANGAWAMCRYIEATETSDPAARDAIVGRILAYNEEDLDATRAVMEWMRSLPAPET